MYRPGGPYVYFVLQLWFQNQARKPMIPARALTATLTFLRHGSPLFPAVSSEWAIANAADNLGFIGTTETWDVLQPNGDFAKVMVMQKRIEDADGYAWSAGAREYAGRRHPSQRIPPGLYEVRVRLRGIDIDKEFVFRLENPGIGGNPAIKEI